MANKFLAGGTISLALVVAVLAGGPAVAQTSATAPPTELGAITVVAPRITYKYMRERGSAVPQMVTVAEKSAQVNFGDLDLTKSSDLYTLEERVNVAAGKVCEELAQQFPDGEPSTPVCTRRAVDDAMPLVRLAAQRAGRP